MLTHLAIELGAEVGRSLAEAGAKLSNPTEGDPGGSLMMIHIFAVGVGLCPFTSTSL